MNDVSNATPLEDLIGELAEEFSQRVRRGESPSVEEYAQRYPDAADKLRRILPALALVVDDDPTLGNSTEDAAKPIPTPQNGILGDYRLRQEIGRGGMGVVYEAEQISLSRRVALKILPFAAVLDQRQIQRFKNEALAAGQLDHPNIVDVYGVGCERSVHFYAMRYVEGDTLSRAIAQLKQNGVDRKASSTADNDCGAAAEPEVPTTPLAALSTEKSATGRAYFRSVAKIGIEIAEALDHAHQQGVIHRDIKPANIIIDRQGKSWVTDFGLARLESGTVMTMTGDLLGTLRYMSPEQALGKRMVVDHRTDIYSLGITLYELLTLEPAFGDEDQHKLLGKIAVEDPRPPRKLNRAIPEELETIVLKAMDKDPSERYETAQEFADDLQRFLEMRPIHAARASTARRFSKWSRRHRGLVASALALLLILTLSSTVGVVLILRETARTEAALEQAEKNFRDARLAQQQAEANFGRARETLDRMLVLMAEKEAGWGVLLEDALAFSRRFADDRSEDPKARFDAARAQRRIGYLLDFRERYDESEQAFRESLRLLGELVARYPANTEYLGELVTSSRGLQVLLSRLARPDEAQRTFETTFQQIDSALAALSEESPQKRGRGYAVRAALRSQHGQWDRAAEDFESASELLDTESPTWFETAWWIVGPYPNRFAEDDPPQRHTDPMRPIPQRGLAVASPVEELRWRMVYLESFGGIDLTKFIPGANIASYMQTRVWSTKEQQLVLLIGSDDQIRVWLNGKPIHEYDQPRMCVHDSDAVIVRLRRGWNVLMAKVMNADHGGYLASLRLSADRADFAYAYAQQGQLKAADQIVAQLLEQHPDMRWLDRLVQRASNPYTESKGWAEACRFLIRVLERQRPEQIDDLAVLYSSLGIALRDRGELGESAIALQQAADLSPRNATVHLDLGAVLAQLDRSVEAADALRDAVRLRPSDTSARHQLAFALARSGRLDEAIAEYRVTLRQAPEYALETDLIKAFREGGLLDDLATATREAVRRNPQEGEAHFRLGMALAELGQWDEAIVSFKHTLHQSPGHAEAQQQLQRSIARSNENLGEQSLEQQVTQ